ncbi:MAG: ATP-binding cassette domain-containing protein [Chloroflexota bacterium]|nr:ATP-binding cassette domain-containing protein [Anaerolineae bacterium]HMM28464.1 ATP-binding cassette domain-containing protein [Aggregatilineaceae bacterium]
MQVELRNINKTFGRVRANQDISLNFEPGRIYAILGENGAGKSTLMKIMSGYQSADSGAIVVDGRAVAFKSPTDAIAHGIGMLYQDPLDFPPFTVLENFIVGRPGGFFPDAASARESLLALARRFNFPLDPDRYLDMLTIGERQQLEILRLLSLNVRALILDEPTTGISAGQKTALFNVLKSLARDEGMTIILVSHKLEDVMELCDEAYVLRRGKYVGRADIPCAIGTLVGLMFGKDVSRQERPPVRHGDPVLALDGVCLSSRRLTVHDVSLTVRAGEVIGLAGLDGSGQAEFIRSCAGLLTPERGTIKLCDLDLTHASYHRVAQAGVAFLPAGRLEEGLIRGMTLVQHFALTMPGKEPWVNWLHAYQTTSERIRAFNVKGRPNSPIQTLSGGNQQRFALSLLPQRLKVLLLEHPTRGLDVESALYIWEQLLQRRADGTAIVFISAELDEIVAYSDRILVFFGGRVTLVDDPADMNTTRLGELIGGKLAS